jgi:hypothetical protein
MKFFAGKAFWQMLPATSGTPDRKSRHIVPSQLHSRRYNKQKKLFY